MPLVMNDEFVHSHQLTNSILFPDNMIGVVKNIDHQYVGINQKTSSLFGFNSAQELINRCITDAELHCKANELSHAFVDEDKRSLHGENSVTTLSACYYHDDELKLFLTEKCIIKSADDNPIGYFIHSIDLTDTGIINMQPLLKRAVPIAMVNGQFSMIIKSEYPGVKLSERQTECLYYMINGYSSAEIGNLISLSRRTVEAYVDHIKDKMRCCSKQELIEKAISLGYLQIIPQSIFSQIMIEKL